MQDFIRTSKTHPPPRSIKKGENKRNEFVMPRYPEVPKRPLILLALIGAQGFLVDVHLLSVKQMYCLRRENEEAAESSAEDVNAS